MPRPLALTVLACLAAHAQQPGPGSCSASGGDGSCPAGGSGRKAPWWANQNRGFSSPHVLEIDTFNFNSTVTTAQRPLLIAFYDPRSQSFKDLKPHLEETAAMLAGLEAPIGQLGACDFTVNTFLGRLQAPELYAGWQEIKQGAFRFSRPRFFPLILIVYEEGERVGEYTGVVSAPAIAGFLRRRSAARGGEALPDIASAQELLQRSGPFAVSCGLLDGSAEQLAFNETAHNLHGALIFGIASQAVCEEVFGGSLSGPWPLVAWAASGLEGAVKSLSEPAPLVNASKLADWLLQQRPELLDEMTPDTSHKYLDRPEPLLIFLVNASDKAGWSRGLSVLTSLEERLVGRVQLVWSDCREFGKQFKAHNQCPVIVVVDTGTMDWKKITLKALLKPRGDAPTAPNASKRLLKWLRNVTGIFLNETGTSGASVGNASTRDDRGTEEGNASSNVSTGGHPGSEEGNASKGREEEEEEGLADSEELLETMPALRDDLPDDDEGGVLVDHYQRALSRLLQLQVSYEARYGRYLTFDFSDLQRAQKLHPSMRSLAASPSSVKRQVQDAEKLKKLWRAIEWKAAFQHNVSKDHFKDKKASYLRLMSQGYEMVRNVYRRLFQHLHEHAASGTVGIPEATEQPVERRDASELSVQEFLDRYAKPGHPVIITGLNITQEAPWTMDFFRERCNVTAAFRRKNARRKAWGRLEHAGVLPLAEFLNTFTSNETRRSWYLHDWSLPGHCPQVFGPAPYPGFTVPKYFAGDYFQRAAFQGYQHTWPSLFVGSNETQSAMHIDSGGTNFWLYLLSGRKEWRFFSRRDLVNVYQSGLQEHFLPDVFSPDFQKFPLLRYAEMYAGVQEAGELIFIPGGNPHAVRNLEHIHGISMNYADLSNIWIYLWHMLAQEDWQAFEMFTDGITFPHGLKSDQQGMRFGEWKSVKWKEQSYDLQ